MNSSRLLNDIERKKQKHLDLHTKDRNFWVKLLRKIKKEFYKPQSKNTSPKEKLFQKTVKPSFTDKTLKDERITLVENNKVVSDESELVEIFSKYFGNIVQICGIDGQTISSDNDNVTIRRAIEKYQNHPSIKVTRENIDTTNNLSFDLINTECVSEIVKS